MPPIKKHPRYAWSRVQAGGHPLAIGYTYRTLSDSLIVFLHGLGCSRLSFRDVWFRQEFAGDSILTLDFSGHGFTSPPEVAEPVMGVQAEILGNLLEFFLNMIPHRKVHLVGHGMGGAIPLLLESQWFERIASFANLEGNLVGSDCGLSRTTAGMSEDMFRKSVPEELLQQLKGSEQYMSLGLVKPKAFHQTARSLVSVSEIGVLMDSWKELSLPKAYFYGARSELESLDEIAASERIEVPDCGHFMMNEQPEAFYPLLGQFIDQHR